jgi:hypothetical protein
MLKNRRFQILAIALTATAFLATISAANASAPSKAGLSWPLKERSVAPPSYRSPLDACFDVPIREVADCHNTSQGNSQILITGGQAANDFSDYHQRHPELSEVAEGKVDMSDYFLRHREIGVPAESSDLSDYFLRH